MKILVFGWFNHQNIGDSLFTDAYKKLFPTLEFTFTDKFTDKNINAADAIFIGGGSFLGDDPQYSENCINLLKTKKLFYIGVGSETDIHNTHLELFKTAKLIAIRTSDKIDLIKEINPNTILISDIVYCLYDSVQKIKKIPKSVLFLPNITLVPNNNDPHWMFASWEYFKSEFSQFLDYIIDDKFIVKIFLMYNNPKASDTWAVIEIINKMKHRNSSLLLEHTPDINDVFKLFSQYETVVTQRFHGIILSELAQTNYIALHHHDKLNKGPNNTGSFIPYYRLNKRKLLDEFYLSNNQSHLLIEPDIFRDLKDRVLSLLG